MSFVKKPSKKIIWISFFVLLVLACTAALSAIYLNSKNGAQIEPTPENIKEVKPSEEENTELEETPPDENNDKNTNKSQINNAVDPTIKPKKDYTQLYPDMYVKRPEKQVSPNKTIFLTFDDGPSVRTGEILDILKQKNVKATFFVIGNTSATGKTYMKRIVKEGHTIAPHTFTHNFKSIYSSVEAYLNDFNKIYTLIYETTGVKPTIFRFAGGSKNSFNKNNYREIVAEMTRRGFDYYDWNLSTGDAAQKSLTPAKKCLSNVLNYSAKYDNAVVLMHDAQPKTTTVQALPALIDGLRNQGFYFQKLSNEIYPVPYSLIKPYA